MIDQNTNLSNRFFYVNPSSADESDDARIFPMSRLISMSLNSSSNFNLMFDDAGVGDHTLVVIVITDDKGREAMKDVVDAINSHQKVVVLGDQFTGESIISDYVGGNVTISEGDVGTFALNGALTVASHATISGNLQVDGRISEKIAGVNLDAQHGTLLAATVLSGALHHTSETGAGNLTTDTAANYISGLGLTTDNQSMKCYYTNDGNQTVTVVAADGNVQIADAGQTIAENESAIFLIRRMSGTVVKVYILGA
jgi:hypothetical protein